MHALDRHPTTDRKKRTLYKKELVQQVAQRYNLKLKEVDEAIDDYTRAFRQKLFDGYSCSFLSLA